MPERRKPSKNRYNKPATTIFVPVRVKTWRINEEFC
jgi:hypothetical protein